MHAFLTSKQNLNYFDKISEVAIVNHFIKNKYKRVEHKTSNKTEINVTMNKNKG